MAGTGFVGWSAPASLQTIGFEGSLHADLITAHRTSDVWCELEYFASPQATCKGFF